MRSEILGSLSTFSPKTLSLIMLRQPMSFKSIPTSVRYLRMHFLKEDIFFNDQSLFDTYYGQKPTIQQVLIEARNFKQAKWALSVVRASYHLDLRILEPTTFTNQVELLDDALRLHPQIQQLSFFVHDVSSKMLKHFSKVPIMQKYLRQLTFEFQQSKGVEFYRSLFSFFPRYERVASLEGEFRCLYEFLQTPTQSKLLKYYKSSIIQGERAMDRQLNDTMTKSTRRRSSVSSSEMSTKASWTTCSISPP